jgi:predicted RNA binding protein YcfA (HicA-like mRNA interferase family)
MKKLRVRGKYGLVLVEALEAAGYTFKRPARGSHLVFSAPERPNAVLPDTIDCKAVALRIARAAKITL